MASMHTLASEPELAVPLPSITPKRRFKDVLGLGPSGVFSDSETQRQRVSSPRKQGTFKRRDRSADITRSLAGRRKVERTSANDISFFDADTTVEIKPEDVNHSAALEEIDSLQKLHATRVAPHSTVHGRRPIRIDAQSGPWTVSVMEAPRDAQAYSLYVKTPTHNLTLTRTAGEIAELHRKLREATTVTMPVLPIDVSKLPPPPKRKSTFLNTLSRLASPNSKASRPRVPTSTITPLLLPKAVTIASPNKEVNDPFTEKENIPQSVESAKEGDQTSNVMNNVNVAKADPKEKPLVQPDTTMITSIAAYLTTISNEPQLRDARPWKRFVRVRTDDLQSVRVERAIKHSRSDVASHIVPKSLSTDTTDLITMVPESSERPSLPDDTPENNPASTEAKREPGIPEEDESAMATESDTQAVVHEENVIQEPASKDHDMIVSPTTPTQVFSRFTDQFESSTSETYTPTEAESSQTETGDEMSMLNEDYANPAVKIKRGLSTKKSQRKVVIDDFEMMRVLGKGCAGKVLLVRHKSTTNLYALKAITKRHVLAHQELQHTLTEQAVLKRMASESKDPFVVKLWWSFHDKENLFLVMDFHPGGDLATQLARWGRLGRDRARFYAAEIVEGVEGLHAAGVIYRDLKPENILIGSDGHIVLTDFGLSKEFPRRANRLATATAPQTPSSGNGEFMTITPTKAPWMRIENGVEQTGWPGIPAGTNDTTTTFCGTAEYLAPEVIQGLPYSYEVDWWSFGTMLYEMLTGITPFWANNHSDMYVRVLQDELQFPDDRAIDQDTKSLIRGLLQRNPALRMCEPRVKKHPYFSMIDWSHVYYKRYIPPYIPPIDPSNASDTQNFDETFLDMEPVLDDPNDNDHTDTDQERGDFTDNDRTDGGSSVNTPLQSRSPSTQPPEDDGVDVFDGYSFKGRHSVLIDSDEESEENAAQPSIHGETADALKDVYHLDNTGVQSSDDNPAGPTTPVAQHTNLPDIAINAASPIGPTGNNDPSWSINAASPKQEETSQPQDDVAAKVSTKQSRNKHLKTPAALTSRKAGRTRREKSGVQALDRDLSDALEEGEFTEHDEEDDDWDFVGKVDGEDRNGAKGSNMFARGVVDRYRMTVFRKASTSQQSVAGSRSFSMASKLSDANVSDAGETPSPNWKERRGRSGLTFRKHPREFLRPKSPSKSSSSSKVPPQSISATLSGPSLGSTTSMLTPSTTTALSNGTHSLKTKESALSVGANSASSDQSGQAEAGGDEASPPQIQDKPLPVQSQDAPWEKTKSKKLQKYKDGAEKVLSIFAASPRQS